MPPSSSADPATPADAGTQRGPRIRVLAQYLRDMSFENPAAGGPGMSEAPRVDLSADVSVRPHVAGEEIYEVMLRLAAKAVTPAGEALFLCEVDYGGLFELIGLSEADTEPMLLIECPRLLFPFARRVMAEITREGGFPPVLVDPIDFLGLYRAQRQAAPAVPAG
jgi:preprotein translocase subunit SecB